MAFYQKYRSQTFSELLGQGHISDTIKEAVKSDKIVHAYLFTGPRGIGKTSTARILARAINCLSPKDGEPCNECSACKDILEGRSIDVTEIDAASHTGVDDIRELIERARLMPANSKKKIYIIDEVHMLSKSAFNALLKTLEEPPAHVVFIMATTEVQKIPATILSRAQRYDFKRATKEDIIENLKKIAKAEKIEIDEPSLDLIALAAEGGHRDSISLFEQVASFANKITITDTRNILGIPEGEKIYQFLGAIFDANPEEGLKIAHDLYTDGVSLVEFNKMIVETLRKVLLLNISGQSLFEDTKENLVNLKKLAQAATTDNIAKIIGIFIEAGNLLKDVSYPILPIEMAVVEATRGKEILPVQTDKDLANSNSQRPTTSQIPNSKFQMPNEMPNAETQKPEDEETVKKAKADSVNSKDQEPTVSQVPKPKIQNVEDGKEMKPADDFAVDSKEPDMVAVPVFEMTDDTWKRIIETMKKENASLAALLKDAKPIEITKNEIVLGVKFAFHKDKISEHKNRAILEKTILEVVGHKCNIRCEIADLRPKPKETVCSDDLKSAVDEIFE